MCKRILVVLLAAVLALGALTLAGDEIGLRTLFGDRPEVTITKSFAVPGSPLSVEAFYDHGALNAILKVDGGWSFHKEPWLAATFAIGGGGRFAGTFWPIEELKLDELSLQLLAGGGVRSEYFVATGDLFFRFQADGIQIVPSVTVSIYDWVIWDTINQFFKGGK